MHTFGMAFRIAGGPDAEFAPRTDVPDQLGSVVIVGRDTAVFRQVTAQGHDILKAFTLKGGDHFIDMLPVRRNAGQVRENLHVILCADFLRQAQRIFAGSPAGAVSYREKSRRERGDLRGRSSGSLESCMRAGRENFKGERDRFRVENICDFHG